MYADTYVHLQVLRKSVFKIENACCLLQTDLLCTFLRVNTRDTLDMQHMSKLIMSTHDTPHEYLATRVCYQWKTRISDKPNHICYNNL